MGFSSSIQFRDPESVIKAFESRNVEAWSISAGKQFMFKGIGRDEFANVIEMLNKTEGSPTYTVQVYEDIEDERKIKNTTPCDGSFNFKFNNEVMEAYTMIKRSLGGDGSPNSIISKLNALEQRLNDSEEEETEEDNSLGMIGKILNHPAIAPVAPKLIENFLGAIMGASPQPANNIVSGNVPNNPAPREENYNVVDELKKHDSNLEKHLEKLLAVAEQDPATFKNIINAFE